MLPCELCCARAVQPPQRPQQVPRDECQIPGRKHTYNSATYVSSERSNQTTQQQARQEKQRTRSKTNNAAWHANSKLGLTLKA
eukprot:1107653-Amphidinium_carterae.1